MWVLVYRCPVTGHKNVEGVFSTRLKALAVVDSTNSQDNYSVVGPFYLDKD